MTSPLRLGIAGIGTVGVGTIRIVQDQAALLKARTGRDIAISAVSARSRDLDRGIRIADYDWADDPVALASRDDVDVFVELIGGADGVAKRATEAAIAAGKDVVTANKALLAVHGQALGEAAEEAGVSIRYEAAVAGGIPCIKALSEGLAGNEITRVMGVMNGTCNYILTRMQSAGLDYQTVFAECEQLGYLEADPNLDVGGIDAGHKLAILVALAFGTKVDFDAVHIEGIKRISIEDIEQAADMGFRIKLLGVAQRTARGIDARMSPCLVPAESPLGQLEGASNMIVLEGDSVGQVVLQGAGAGEGPTASAVIGDICDLARGSARPVFGKPVGELVEAKRDDEAASAAYYLRMQLVDRPGALAKIAAVLGDAGISINRMRQYRHTEATAPVLIVTHEAKQEALHRAIANMEGTDVLASAPVAIRIEKV